MATYSIFTYAFDENNNYIFRKEHSDINDAYGTAKEMMAVLPPHTDVTINIQAHTPNTISEKKIYLAYGEKVYISTDCYTFNKNFDIKVATHNVRKIGWSF